MNEKLEKLVDGVYAETLSSFRQHFEVKFLVNLLLIYFQGLTKESKETIVDFLLVPKNNRTGFTKSFYHILNLGAGLLFSFSMVSSLPDNLGNCLIDNYYRSLKAAMYNLKTITSDTNNAPGNSTLTHIQQREVFNKISSNIFNESIFQIGTSLENIKLDLKPFGENSGLVQICNEHSSSEEEKEEEIPSFINSQTITEEDRINELEQDLWDSNEINNELYQRLSEKEIEIQKLRTSFELQEGIVRKVLQKMEEMKRTVTPIIDTCTSLQEELRKTLDPKEKIINEELFEEHGNKDSMVDRTQCLMDLKKQRNRFNVEEEEKESIKDVKDREIVPEQKFLVNPNITKIRKENQKEKLNPQLKLSQYKKRWSISPSHVRVSKEIKVMERKITPSSGDKTDKLAPSSYSFIKRMGTEEIRRMSQTKECMAKSGKTKMSISPDTKVLNKNQESKIDEGFAIQKRPLNKISSTPILNLIPINNPTKQTGIKGAGFSRAKK